MRHIIRRCPVLFFTVFLLAVCAPFAAAADAVPGKVLSAADSVVRIYAEYPDGTAGGSGFVIESGGGRTLVATNYHVVEGDPYEISVWVGNDDSVSARIAAQSEQKDLCVLELAYPADIPALTLAGSPAEQGDAVYAIGYPAAADDLSGYDARAGGDATITNGIVSAVRETILTEYGSPVVLLQINAAINAGNSGGPLLNSYGEVVGINALGAYDSQGIYGAIAIGELEDLLADSEMAETRTEEESGTVYAVGAAAFLAAAAALLIILKNGRGGRGKRRYPKSALTLGSLVTSGGRLSGEEAAALLTPAAEALAYLHGQGKAHLSVSPESVVCRGGRACLPEKFRGNTAALMSGFTPPELYRGYDCGAASDIYSFCAVLYFAVTGMAPENALVREEAAARQPCLRTGGAEPESAEEAPPVRFAGADPYSERLMRVVEKGMSIRPEERFSSMRALVDGLGRPGRAEAAAQPAKVPEPTDGFREQSAVTRESPGGTQEPPVWMRGLAGAEERAPIRVRTKRPGSAVRAGIIAGSCALLIALALGGVWYYSYTEAVKSAESGDFAAAEKYLETAPLAGRHEPELIPYIGAGLLLEDRQFEKAEAAFSSLGDYLRAPEMANEARYRRAAQLADENEFQAAISLYQNLAKTDYKDSGELVSATRFRHGTYELYELGDYETALGIFRKLDNVGYEPEKTGEMLSYITETLYSAAQQAYYDGDYDQAEAWFDLVSPYGRSDDYNTLIYAKDYVFSYLMTQDDPGEVLEKLDSFIRDELVPLFDFENTQDILLSEDYACDFLIGRWETDDGKRYFIMERTEDGYDNYCNIDVSRGSFEIIDGVYYLDGEERYIFWLLTPDSMHLYSCASGKTYTLYR